MSLELGLCITIPIIAAIFIYLSINEKKEYFKMMYEMIAFGLLIAALDVCRRLASAGGSPAEVIDMFGILMIIMIIIFGAMLFIYLIMAVKDALEMFIPKKRLFSETRDD